MIIKKHLKILQKITSGAQYEFYRYINREMKFFEKKDAFCANKELLKLCRSSEVKRCFFNARKIALNKPEYKYFEGYYVVNELNLVLEHAFLVKDGKVFDPTAMNNEFDVVEWAGVEVPIDLLRKPVSYKSKLIELFELQSNSIY